MSDPRARSIAVTAAAGVIQRLLQVTSTLIVIPVVLGSLGVGLFGIWGSATSLTGLTAFLDAGVSSALIARIPRAMVSEGLDAARDEVAAALSVAVFIALLVALLSVAWLLGVDATATTKAVATAAICMGLNVPLSISGSVWFGLNKGYVANIWEAVQSLLQLASVWTLRHHGLMALVCAIYVPILVCNASSLVHVLGRHPALRPRFGSVPRQSFRAILGPGLSLFAIYIANSGTFVFDTVLSLQWLGPVAAAQMTPLIRICTTATALLAVVSQPLWPAFADAHHRSDRSWIRRYLYRGSAATFGAALAGGLIIALCGQWLVRTWLGAELHIPSTMFWVAALWIVTLGTPRVASLYLCAAGVLRPQLAAAVATLMLAFVLKWWWAAPLGNAGILLASAVSWLAVIWPVYAWYAADTLHSKRAAH